MPVVAYCSECKAAIEYGTPACPYCGTPLEWPKPRESVKNQTPVAPIIININSAQDAPAVEKKKEQSFGDAIASCLLYIIIAALVLIGLAVLAATCRV